jgi:probable nitrogen fixation protein
MSVTDSATETTTTDITSKPLLQEIVRQIRGQDTYGVYRSWSDELVLKPFVVTKEKKRQISIEGEVDPVTKARIMAYFRAIAIRIEKETGLLGQVVVDLSHEGFGWALVFGGRLLVVAKTLRDAQRFGFDSFEKLEAEGEKLVQKGIELARRYPEVGKA